METKKNIANNKLNTCVYITYIDLYQLKNTSHSGDRAPWVMKKHSWGIWPRQHPCTGCEDHHAGACGKGHIVLGNQGAKHHVTWPLALANDLSGPMKSWVGRLWKQLNCSQHIPTVFQFFSSKQLKVWSNLSQPHMQEQTQKAAGPSKTSHPNRLKKLLAKLWACPWQSAQHIPMFPPWLKPIQGADWYPWLHILVHRHHMLANGLWIRRKCRMWVKLTLDPHVLQSHAWASMIFMRREQSTWQKVCHDCLQVNMKSIIKPNQATPSDIPNERRVQG